MTTIPLRRIILPRLLIKREYLSIVFWLLLFLESPGMLRHIDITAAPIDPGALSAIILSVLAVLIFLAVTWWVIKTLWPALANYSEHLFETDFISLSPWQNILIYLAFYLSLLLAFVFTLSAVLG